MIGLWFNEDAAQLAVKIRTLVLNGGSEAPVILFSGCGNDSQSPNLLAECATPLSLMGDVGKIVVLDVNADQTVHEMLGCAARPGFGELMSDNVTLDDAIIETAYEGIWMIPFGSGCTPDQLLKSGRQLIEACQTRFDVVLINASGIKGGNEAFMLASWSDHTIIVGEKNRVTRAELSQAKKLVESTGNSFFGYVLSERFQGPGTNGEKLSVIQLLHTMDYGGVETILINWYKSMDREKIDLHVVCFKNTGNTERLFVEAAEEAGITVHTIPWHRGKPVLSAAYHLSRILRQVNADILHTHNLYADIVGLVAGKWTGVRLVSSLYVLSDFGWPRNLMQWIDQKVLGWFNLVTVQCEITGVEACKRGLPDDKVKVLHSGFNTVSNWLSESERSKRRGEFGALDDDVVLVCVSRLYPEKAHDKLLIAFKMLRSRYDNLKLWILGVGPLEEEVKAQCKALGLLEDVRFTGFVTKLDELLQLADIQVHPSHAEGIPMGILSGMANGLPIVASGVGGIPEVVTHDYSGLLVTTAAAVSFQEEFVDAVALLVDDADRRRTLGASGRAFIEDDYSLENAAKTLFHYYESVVRL